MITNNIIRSTKQRDRYNCVTFSTHERYQNGLDEVKADFFMLKYGREQGFKPWNEKYGKIPDNHVFLKEKDIYVQVPDWLEVDFILSQNRFGNYQIAKEIQRVLHVPIIQLEHTLPAKGIWPPEKVEACKNMRGEINVFISDFSMREWGFEDEEVIHHCVDGDFFHDMGLERENKILTVANDYKNRDYFLNFQQYERVTEGLPVTRVGDTPGFSEAATDLEELRWFYNTNTVFLNTAHLSPIPTVMLEAAACGMPIVSCRTCAIPDYFTDKRNILFADSDEEMRAHLEFLLENQEFARELGQRAREDIIKVASKEKFTQKWNEVFDKAANTPYLG